jgi:pyridoxamine 5'-phosphate oxidase
MSHPDPFDLFREWFDMAQRTDLPEPSAASLATVSPDGRPSVRMILIRGFDRRGFVFYTNMESRKATDLGGPGADGAPAALCLYWITLNLQVRIEGRTEAVSPEEADAYWATRPRAHQVAAYASRQSRPLAGGRAQLEAAYRECDRKLPLEEVPRPANWSGFRLIPSMIEFWEGRGNRLHHRVLYERDGAGWKVTILNP